MKREVMAGVALKKRQLMRKKQCIREDGRVKTEFRVRAVEGEVRPMTHIFVVVVLSPE